MVGNQQEVANLHVGNTQKKKNEQDFWPRSPKHGKIPPEVNGPLHGPVPPAMIPVADGTRKFHPMSHGPHLEP